MYLIFVLTLGLIVGSFLNVCIHRIPREESIAYPPSNCNSCGYNLKAVDLIPVISYLFLGGECRVCKEKISLRYPIIEIINSIIYGVIFLKFGFTLNFFKYCILCSLLLVIGMIDNDTKEVYSSTTIFGAVIGITFIVIDYWFNGIKIGNFIIGGIIGFLVIYFIVILTRGMGEGDADIAGICGLFLGWQGIILTLFLAFVTGGIRGIYILITKKGDKKTEMAFGPYIALGALITIIFGQWIIRWYYEFLLNF